MLVACLIACGTVVAPAGAATNAAPRAALEGFVCQRAASHFNRAIAVVGVMRPMTGTQEMAMKFVLQRRTMSGGAFAPVQGRDLGRWLMPTPATLGQRPNDEWRLTKLVVNLASAVDYRFRVTFRWTGAAGAMLGRTALLSPGCAQ
jgi:hypothetical protein